VEKSHWCQTEVDGQTVYIYHSDPSDCAYESEDGPRSRQFGLSLLTDWDAGWEDSVEEETLYTEDEFETFEHSYQYYEDLYWEESDYGWVDQYGFEIDDEMHDWYEEELTGVLEVNDPNLGGYFYGTEEAEDWDWEDNSWDFDYSSDCLDYGFYYDEGPNMSFCWSDCDCDGNRACSLWGYCQGESRPADWGYYDEYWTEDYDIDFFNFDWSFFYADYEDWYGRVWACDSEDEGGRWCWYEDQNGMFCEIDYGCMTESQAIELYFGCYGSDCGGYYDYDYDYEYYQYYDYDYDYEYYQYYDDYEYDWENYDWEYDRDYHSVGIDWTTFDWSIFFNIEHVDDYYVSW